MENVKTALTYAILRELSRAEDDRLLVVLQPQALNRIDIAERIATKLIEGRDEYRAGRRTIDMLRTKLWRALRWRPGHGSVL